MGRTKSVTTRIHQPPAPPCWFRTVFYLSFGAWILLQSATEYYTYTSLHMYTHLDIFAFEEQVTAAFLSIMSVGVLTIWLVLAFIYGICTVSRLIVLSSASFLSTLLILNITSVGILSTSNFGLDLGRLVHNEPVLNIYHENVSTDHLRSEIKAWSVQYPLSEQAHRTTGGPMTTIAAPADTASASSPADGGSGRAAADAVTPASAGSNGTALTTAAPDSAAAAAAANSSSGTASTPPAGKTRQQLSASVESQVLFMVSFLQQNAFCCGADGPYDYKKVDAQTPPTCSCRDERHQDGNLQRPPCSAKPHTLANGEVSAVWERGCVEVKEDMVGNINSLRDMLFATLAVQALMMALSLVLGLNMPRGRSDDSDDETGDY